jgi:hypothetical protein
MSATVSTTVTDVTTRPLAVRAVPVRLARAAVEFWLRRIERRVAVVLHELGHEGVLEDARTAGLPPL